MITQLLLIDFIYTFVFAVAADSLVIVVGVEKTFIVVVVVVVVVVDVVVVVVVVIVVGGGVEKTFMRAVGRRSIGQRNNN